MGHFYQKELNKYHNSIEVFLVTISRLFDYILTLRMLISNLIGKDGNYGFNPICSIY